MNSPQPGRRGACTAPAGPFVFRLYNLLGYLLLPFLAVFALIKPGYPARWRERLGLYREKAPAGGIVVHAASVGEVNAAEALIQGLRKRLAGIALTVTCFTPTGSNRIRSLFPGQVYHVYAPLDLPGAVRRFYRHVRPRLLIVMETEIWPNLYLEAAKNNIPVMMANARISGNSMTAYRRIRGLVRQTLTPVARVAAQSTHDATRLSELGVQPGNIEVTGNLKFDVNLPEGLQEQGRRVRQNWGPGRPVLLAASTHEGDEWPVLAAFSRLLRSFPQALLVLAPRHPQRARKVARAARSSGLVVQIHNDEVPCPAETHCLVVDTLGMLLACYAACDVAFVGGSLDRVGGHNVLEPAALSVPVLIGPHTFNFADVTRQLLDCGGALCVHDDTELARSAARLLGDAALRREMGKAGLALVRGGQGALQRVLNIVTELLEPV